MDVVRFSTALEEFGVGTCAALLVHVNGAPLQELLRRIELPSARREGNPELAGSYRGLTEDGLVWPSRHFLGEPVLSGYDDGDTVLLGCGCGVWSCWPFTATVTVDDDVVTWSRYRNGHRDWDYRDLRDLVFDREQYEEALRQTAPTASPYGRRGRWT